MLDNPQLDQPLEAVFRQGAIPAPTAEEPSPDAPQRRPLEVVPPGWHGQV
jgi:membrane protein